MKYSPGNIQKKEFDAGVSSEMLTESR